ncbi:protein of unknown function [Candidatus Nitrosacidococcus tergens]|uniref:N6 adenine-specific DNA methyltransferase N-terminal domain-containing protein n=1 Tax=Candidatus Nitrosacidococcus tergens TaxID=553981 RepID=A0A7G1Q9P9_9GAMM|nr:protein of unknown function [Candidatus Nitrosacidococcus tergens]
MAIKKSELYSSLRTSCDKLRGEMDTTQYKDYVLTLPLLFVKYISDKYKDDPYAAIYVARYARNLFKNINKMVKVKENLIYLVILEQIFKDRCTYDCLFHVVPEAGIEPARGFPQGIFIPTTVFTAIYLKFDIYLWLGLSLYPAMLLS